MAGPGAARRVPNVVAYGVLAVVLWVLYRFTTIGIDRVPDSLPCAPTECGPDAAVALAAAPASPRHLLVPVRLNGLELELLLDTGSASTVLAADGAPGWGALAASRTVLGAVNDRFGLQRVLVVERLVVAGRAYGDFDVAVAPLAGLRDALGPRVAGVLGADVLGLQPFEIDFRAPSLRLGRERARFEASRPVDAAETTVPVDALAGGFFVRALADERTGYFLVDSGSNVSQIGEARASGLGSVQRSTGRAIDAAGGEQTTLRSVPLSVLAVGALARGPFEVVVGDPPLLGNDFFAGLLLRIDPAEGLLTLRAAAGDAPVRSPPASTGDAPRAPSR